MWPLNRTPVEVLQVNIGKRCNLTCRHCHVESGPTRTENMDEKTANRLLELLEQSPSIHTVDFTGGAPELNPNFKLMIQKIRKMKKSYKIIDRCNLTVFYEEGMDNLPQFLADNQVEIVASLPCYSPKNVDKQRGKGVFDGSVKALLELNKLGYGSTQRKELELVLVFNPGGASLPANQSKLEVQYREELQKHFGIEFTRLVTITNMPIKRFADDLVRLGEYGKYMELLVNSFNPETVNGLMCKNLINVGWDGSLFDCDFNQALELQLGHNKGKRFTIWDLDSFEILNKAKIATDIHCYGCTAGFGSSCSGSLAK